MDYLRRFFGGGIEEPLLQPTATYPPYTSPAADPSPSPHISWHPHTRTPSRRRHHKHKRKHSNNMGHEPFNGPACKDLVEFMKSVKGMPSKYKTAFESISKETIETICDPDALHVWESDSDLDNLLQLTQVIVKLRNISSSASHNDKKSKDPAMVIIAEEKKGRDNFERIVELVRHLTGGDGKKHLGGTVCAFDAIVIARGIDYASDKEDSAAVKRINTSIERVFKMTRPPTKKIIWHHGPILSLLLTWINTTTSPLRNALTGITIIAALDLADGVKPSPLGKPNKLPDLTRLENYARKLGIPVVFLDPGSQLITYDYLATYMYFWAYYVNTFLPTMLSRPHLYKALDELVMFCFRLRGASEGTYGDDVVRMVQSHLDASKARRWARSCVATSSYTKEPCRAAGSDLSIHHAVQLADSPFAQLSQIPGYPLPAFSRLPVCPSPSSTSAAKEYYIAAPVTFSFANCSFKASHPSPFHILLPSPGQDAEKVTARIQGTMMGVLERVRQDKGMPRFGDGEREVWKGVVAACEWALKGVKGKCPEGVEEKVGFVREKLREGTYGFAVGVAGKGKKVGSSGGEGRWK